MAKRSKQQTNSNRSWIVSVIFTVVAVGIIIGLSVYFLRKKSSENKTSAMTSPPTTTNVETDSLDTTTTATATATTIGSTTTIQPTTTLIHTTTMMPTTTLKPTTTTIKPTTTLMPTTTIQPTTTLIHTTTMMPTTTLKPTTTLTPTTTIGPTTTFMPTTTILPSDLQRFPPSGLSSSTQTVEGDTYIVSSTAGDGDNYVVFDHDNTTDWYPNLNQYSGGDYIGTDTTTVNGSTISGVWIQLFCSSSFYLYSYTFRGSLAPDTRLPKDFTLAGSLDGTTWNEVDSQTNILSSSYDVNTTDKYKTFIVNNTSNAYNYYRFIVSKNNGSSNLTFIELELNGFLTTSVNSVTTTTIQPTTTTSWVCLSDIPTPVRINSQGDLECMSSNNTGCLWKSSNTACNDLIANPPTVISPLSCGDMHYQVYGSTGYESSDHWCARGKTYLTATTLIPTTTIAPIYKATGDFTVSTYGSYILISFLSGTGSIVFTNDKTVDVLIVAGGGGGGFGSGASGVDCGAGGGAGGVGIGQLNFTANTTYNVSVGDGGNGGIRITGTVSESGGDSTLTGGALNETAYGGGWGGNTINQIVYQSLSAGGSSGGANTAWNRSGTGVADATTGNGSITYYGNMGSDGGWGGGGGGGGGASSSAADSWSSNGADGGHGLTWDINDTTYGGGGGGSAFYDVGTPGNGGTGGGGNGGSSSTSPGDGSVNTGGGGGGGANDGGNGGSGIIIIAFAV